jgi:hypothetical protein
MKGIDISKYQGNVNFDMIKAAGIEIVYIKATEGLTYTDSMLKTYYTKAKAAGIKVGFYHFLRANDPVAEAKHFLDTINGLEADCKYAIDAETEFSTVSSSVRKFADYLISQGKEPLLYTYEYFYRDTLNSTVKDLPFWIANYNVSTPKTCGWVGFQYSESGAVSGIAAKVDLDTFNQGILLSAIKNGWHLESGIWHYYQKSVMVKHGWAQDSHKKWFWLDDNGNMLINGWVLWKDKWYYFGADGAMFTNIWAYWKGKQYYLDSEGAMLTNCKTPDGYYVNEKGEWDGKPK